MRTVRTLLTITLAAALAVVCACAGKPAVVTTDSRGNTLTPVAGRTSTGTGLTFDFPSGWIETTDVAPFTKVYRNDPAQIDLKISELALLQLIPTLGQSTKERFTKGNTIHNDGPLKVQGRDAYRFVVDTKTATGQGVVYALFIEHRPGRAVAVYLSSQGDATARQKAEIEALIETVQFE